MRRRPSPGPELRVPLALLAVLGGLAACRPSGGTGECPGTALARVSIALTRTAAQCSADTRPGSAGTAACLAATPRVIFDCETGPPPIPPCCFDALYPAKRTSAVTVAFEDPGSASGPAAICTGQHDALALKGTHAGDALTVSLELPSDQLLGGSVLTACSASCLVDLHQDLTATLVRAAPGGPITGLVGTLVESDTPIAGADCTPCTGPCSATWAVAPPQP